MSDSPELPFHKIPEEHGGGYLAMLEVFHLLHCLVSFFFSHVAQCWCGITDIAEELAEDGAIL